MRVLITAPSLDEHRNVSGISTVVRQIIEHRGGETVHFEAGRSDGESAGFAWMLKQMALPFRMWTSISQAKPDVIHLNTSFTTLAILRDATLSTVARLRRRPVVLAVHGGRYLVRDAPGSILSAIAGRLFRRASKIVVLTEHERESLLKRDPTLDIEVLPNAVDAPKWLKRSENAVPVVIYLGRMHADKGIFEIAQAMTELNKSDLEFTIFGDGPERDRFIETMTAALGSRFEYGGVVSGDDKWTALANADIFLLPSHHEGMPLALLEAMAAGCVVIASDLPGLRGVVENGVNGHLTPPGDAVLLADKISEVLNDRQSWSMMRTNARTLIAERFAIAGYIDSLENIYNEAVRTR